MHMTIVASLVYVMASRLFGFKHIPIILVQEILFK